MLPLLFIFLNLTPAIVIALNGASTPNLLASLTASTALLAFAVLVAQSFKTPWYRGAMLCVLLCPLLILQIIRAISFYIQGEGINERLLAHIDITTLVHGSAAYKPAILGCVLLITTSLVIAWRLGSHKVHFFRLPTPARVSLATVFLAISILLDPALSRLMQWQFQSLVAHQNAASEQLDSATLLNLGINPKAAPPLDALKASPGQNLVIIYVESLEQAFAEPDLFPQLTPNLQTLISQSQQYTNLQQTEGTGWTIGGIVASQCGTPLVQNHALAGSNDLLRDGFLNRAVCLGDVLNAAGYQQVYLGGAPVEFAGKGNFLLEHGYDEAIGLKQIKADPKLKKEAQISGWGLYDQSLFELATLRFDQLASQPSQPFNLTLLTLDTHIPARPSPTCSTYPLSQSADLQAAHCTDQLLGRFVRHIQEHPAAEHTTIVILSDHLAFKSVSASLIPKDYPRRLLFLVLNENGAKLNDVNGSHMDIAPTILAAAGVSHNGEFLLGEDLANLQERPANINRARQINVVKTINSELLTAQKSVCGSGKLLEQKGESLLLGGIPLTMSLDGWPVKLSDIGRRMTIVSRVDTEGTILTSTLIRRDHLYATLLAHFLPTPTQERTHLLITAPSDSLPTAWRQGAENSVTTLLVDNAGNLINRVVTEDATQVTMPSQNCSLPLSRQDSVTFHNLRPDDCMASADSAGFFDAASGTLTINDLELAGTHYQAQLNLQKDRGIYRVNSYQPFRTPNRANCGAVISGKHMIIPVIDTPEGQSGLIFQRSAEEEPGQIEMELIYQSQIP